MRSARSAHYEPSEEGREMQSQSQIQSQQSRRVFGHTDSDLKRRTSTHSATNKKGYDVSTAELVNYRRLFDTFDTDGSDFLNFEELKYMLLCLGISVDDEAVEELKTEFDADGSGTLDFEEFVHLMQLADLQSRRTIPLSEERKHITQVKSNRFAQNAVWRMTWDVTILFFTWYHVITAVYQFYQPIEQTTEILVIEIFMTLIFSVDVAIFGNSGYQDENGKSVEDIKKVLRRYAKTSMVPDILGALPFDLIYTGIVIDYHRDPGYLVLRALRLLRLYRVTHTLFLPYSVTGFLTPRFVYFVYHIAPVLRAVFLFVCLVHILTVGWLAVVNSPERVTYVDGLYLILYTLSTVGYGDVFVVGMSQRLYCCFLFITGVMMNGVVISQMSVFLSKADISTERKDKMRETLAVLSHFDIPHDTQSEILSFQNHLLEHNLGSSHESLIAALPRSIQDSLGLFMKIKYISMVPMFSSANHECKVALANIMMNIVFQPAQFIIIAGEEGKEMYFLGHGVADVIHPKGTYLATLLKGNFFGEIALLVDQAKRTASIKALTYCDVFRLEKSDFSSILAKFPMFRESVKVEMEERVAQFRAGQKAQQAQEEEKKAKAKEEKLKEEGGVTLKEEGSRAERPKSAYKPILKHTGEKQGSPLIEIKADLVQAAVEQAGVTKEARFHGGSSAQGDTASETSSLEMVASTTSFGGRQHRRQSRQQGATSMSGSTSLGGHQQHSAGYVTAEQRDKARAVAINFLQGSHLSVGAPPRAGSAAGSSRGGAPHELPNWQASAAFAPSGGFQGPTPTPSPGVPQLPKDSSNPEIRQLLDRMNQMEQFMLEHDSSGNVGSPCGGGRPETQTSLAAFESIPRVSSNRAPRGISLIASGDGSMVPQSESSGVGPRQWYEAVRPTSAAAAGSGSRGSYDSHSPAAANPRRRSSFDDESPAENGLHSPEVPPGYISSPDEGPESPGSPNPPVRAGSTLLGGNSSTATPDGSRSPPARVGSSLPLPPQPGSAAL